LDSKNPINPLIYKGNLEQWKKKEEELNQANPWLKTKNQSHADRLRSTLGFWKAAGANLNVLSWLVNGIYPLFEKKPAKLSFPNKMSYFEHIQFVHAEISDQIKSGTLKIVTNRFARCIHPIQVEVGKKLRLCIDSLH
jgi:hypothetical protein